MKYTIFVFLFITTALLILSGCKLEEPIVKKSTIPPVSWGDADFTRYVALGNSLTAGYSSAALTV